MTLEKLKKLSNDELNERFPFMVCRKVYIDDNDKDDLVRDDFGHLVNHFEDWGWRDIQLALAEHIKPIYDKFKDETKQHFFLMNVKEKWGRLDNYWSLANDKIMDWDGLAEYVSSFTCIKCGKTLKVVRSVDRYFYSYWQSRGWICPYCSDCKDKDEEYNQLFADDFVTIEKWQPDGPHKKIIIDVDEFWKLPEED